MSYVRTSDGMHAEFWVCAHVGASAGRGEPVTRGEREHTYRGDQSREGRENIRLRAGQPPRAVPPARLAAAVGPRGGPAACRRHAPVTHA
eukprot:9171943-Pyramimonas_sp.AAC.1